MISSKKEQNYEELARKVVKEINKVREDPTSYIEKIENQMRYLQGSLLKIPGQEAIITNEGELAYEEALGYLKNKEGVKKLKSWKPINLVCEDHVNDIGEKGLITHDSSDWKNLGERAGKYCKWQGAINENLDFGNTTAENIVIAMLIDDGVADRTRRENIFNNDFNYIGAACGDHKEYHICTAIVFLSDFSEDRYEESIKSSFPKNSFQEKDPDAPDNTIGVKTIITTKIIEGKPHKLTKKIFTLQDNTQHIVEIIDQ